MKFTSEDLMKAMGLQTGDRIRVYDKEISATFEVTNDYGLFRLDHVDIPNARTGYELHHIFGLDFEILPKPKRAGELECNHDCSNCPLRIISSCRGCGSKTLYKILETYKTLSKDDDFFDQEIYDLLKARLDRVME